MITVWSDLPLKLEAGVTRGFLFERTRQSPKPRNQFLCCDFTFRALYVAPCKSVVQWLLYTLLRTNFWRQFTYWSRHIGYRYLYLLFCGIDTYLTLKGKATISNEKPSTIKNLPIYYKYLPIITLFDYLPLTFHAPSIWWAAVATPNVNPSGNLVYAMLL